MLRGASLSTFEISMSQKVEKGPFATLIIESFIKVSWKYFQKLMWLYLLTTKDSLMGKVWGKTFSRCEMLWTAPREIATKELERNTRRGSCVLYNRAEHIQGFSICYKECSGMLRNLPECSMGLDLSMVLKPSALFSLLYSLLRFIDYITDWFEIDSWIY